MGIFDKIRSALGGGNEEEAEFRKTVNELTDEYAANHQYFWTVNFNEIQGWQNGIKNWPDKKKISFVLWLLKEVHDYAKNRTSWSSEDKGHKRHTIQLNLVPTIFRNKLLLDDDDAVNIFRGFFKYRLNDHAHITTWPVNLFINQVERQYKGTVLSPAMRNMLLELKDVLNNIQQAYEQKERIKMIQKIDTLLFEAENKGIVKPVRFMGEDRLADFANPMIAAMQEDEAIVWYRLLGLAQKASGSKPSDKYLSTAKELIKEMGADKFKTTVNAWFQFLIALKEKEEQHTTEYAGRTYTHSSYEYITGINADMIKGLLWSCGHFHDNATIQTVSALAERAFRKIPGQGPAAASIGNACLYMLYKSKGLDGVGQLSRLKLRIKQNSTQHLIEKYLQAAAAEQGVAIGEIEDMAVDDCGFENEKRTFLFDDYKAELIITGIGKTEQRWFKPDGSPQKSVPASVKEKHGARLKKLKDIARQAEQTLTGQRDRIDRMFRNDRKIDWENFKKYYLEHGLLSYIANKLIWNFHQENKTAQAILVNGKWVNNRDEEVSIENTVSVSLWHPVQATVEEIRDWRNFLIAKQLQQPMKQAFREVYLLTDAEINTRTYSNRMAAHILRQHQFNSLAKTRGWRYALMGAFDNGYDNGTASLLLPEYHLKAEYWINEVNANDQTNDTGIWNYVSTDQVRFINTETNEVVELVNIPPLVLSETLRDVDLFVGVASVGNDPAWADTGGMPVYRDYWQSYSFGELSELAKNRKEILTGLVPRLKIKDVAEIRDKFLVVKGTKRTYKIHIGSTNILMEPNDQYLCIVPDRGAKSQTENLFLPFEGDAGLSVILSKAFLLAADDKITDTTITSQINRK